MLGFYPFLTGFEGSGRFFALHFSKYLEFWPHVLGFTVFAALMPNMLAFAGMKQVEAATAGILLLFEPISAALFAYFLFAQPLTPNVWIGGGLILLANCVLIRGERRKP